MAGIAPSPVADYYSDDDDFDEDEDEIDLGLLDDDTDESDDIFGDESTDVDDTDDFDLSPPLFLTTLKPVAPGAVTTVPTTTGAPPVVTPKIKLNVLPKTPTMPGTLPQPMPKAVVPGLPQPMPKAVVPGLPQQAQPLPQPKITPLAGAAVPAIAAPSVPALNAMPKPVAKKEVTDISEIITKLEGITIAGVTPPPADIPANIDDILLKEADETPENFEARKRLTYQVSSIPDYGINPLAAVNIGHMWMKKTVLGITYDTDIEAALSRILSLLER